MAGFPDLVPGLPDLVAGLPDLVAGLPDSVGDVPDSVAGLPDCVGGRPDRAGELSPPGDPDPPQNAPVAFAYNPRMTRFALSSNTITRTLTITMMILFTLAGAAAGQDGADEEAGGSGGGGYMRVVDEAGRPLTLQIAARSFERADNDDDDHDENSSPVVTLVGVAHIGERGLYKSLQEYLDGFDVVLYESVKPSGAGRPAGDTAEERIEATRASLRFLAGVAELYREQHERYPDSLDDLVKYVEEFDSRFAGWVEAASVDAWDGSVRMSVDEAGESPSKKLKVTSLGADGAPGGDDEDADLVIDEAVPAIALSSEGGIQAELADALNLDFQLAAMNYDRDNWQCSDMTLDVLNRELSERGIDFFMVDEAQAMGTSLPQKVATILLRLLKAADAFFDGAVTDGVKVAMIEMLGRGDIVEQALDQQFGRGFAEVIVEQRNQVVMDDLKVLLDGEAEAVDGSGNPQNPGVESVAIFYGAAHMRDFEQRLAEQFGYQPVDVRWFDAMAVDLETSALSRQELEQLRRMIRMQLRMSFGR